MRIALAIPDAAVTPEFIEGALEAATLGNQALLRDGMAPTASSLLRAGAKWRPEPKSWGAEHFDLLPTIGARGWGDCDDWAPGLAAELRHTGEDPGARAVIRRSGAKRWHALVQQSDGTILDPSKWAGMPSGRIPRVKQQFADGIAGAVIVPNGRRGWFARVDLPTDAGHIVGVGWGCTDPACALRRAAWAVGPSHVMGADVAGACEEVIGGLDLSSLGSVAGGVAGGAFGGPLGAAAGSALGGMAGDALGSMMSGGDSGTGAPVAPPAPTAAPSSSASLPGGGSVSYGPGAPIIVRF